MILKYFQILDVADKDYVGLLGLAAVVSTSISWMDKEKKNGKKLLVGWQVQLEGFKGARSSSCISKSAHR